MSSSSSFGLFGTHVEQTQATRNKQSFRFLWSDSPLPLMAYQSSTSTIHSFGFLLGMWNFFALRCGGFPFFFPKRMNGVFFSFFFHPGGKTQRKRKVIWKNEENTRLPKGKKVRRNNILFQLAEEEFSFWTGGRFSVIGASWF